MLKLDKSVTFFPEFSILICRGQTSWKYVVFREGRTDGSRMTESMEPEVPERCGGTGVTCRTMKHGAKIPAPYSFALHWESF